MTPRDAMPYREFLTAKLTTAPDQGFAVPESDLHPILLPHQRAIVRWALQRGRAAIFASFGLGKGHMQVEIARQVMRREGGRFLIVCPLGVRQEFAAAATMLGVGSRFIRRLEEADREGLYLTNYETVRDGKLDPRQFTGISLDEAAILRGFGGVLTFRKFMERFDGWGRFKFVATATPSPNELLELAAYAAFLDVSDVSSVKTRFFKRDSTKADHLSVYPHKQDEFWRWVSTWALFLDKPSDLGFDDTGYELPPMSVCWREVETDHAAAGCAPNGQGKLLRDAALGVTDAAREKRDSIRRRMAMVEDIIQRECGGEQFIVWCDQNREQEAAERLLREAGIPYTSISGATDQDAREEMLAAWKRGETIALVTKPGMYGAGANLQNCAIAIYAGISFQFAAFIQSLHRIHRFLQRRPVRVFLVYTEAEREVRRALQQKWEQHDRLVAEMTAIVRRHGLSGNAMTELARGRGVERREDSGPGWRMIHNDCIAELPRMDPNSVHLILTSIPFSSQYEYSPNLCDFGHNESNESFFRQMGYLTPELLRVLSPGRIAAIHVKDRIVPSGLSGLGFQTVYPFHADCIRHYQSHGFAYLGMKTIVTDVVRENNQTYRLGWSEQCKDGSRMGVGMPEYLLLFRKPPSDRSNGYADVPVVKHKSRYTRSRWQIDAHGFARSSGDRLLSAADLRGVPHATIFKLFRRYSLLNRYDFEHHVALSESLEGCRACGQIHAGERKCIACDCTIAGSLLPSTFMLLQPQSWHPDVWTDITRMLGLNSRQERRGVEQHLCPLQFDLADRAIEQYTMPGETVLDPFAGIGTVPYRALLAGRSGIGIELAPGYYRDACYYCAAGERERGVPTLFDLEAADDGGADQYREEALPSATAGVGQR